MLEMRAIIIKVHGDEASVQPVGSGGCGHCDSEGGCGSGTLSKLFCSSKPRQFTVRNKVQAKMGDEVLISLPDGILLRGALKMYLVPLALLMAGGISGSVFASDAGTRDAYAVAGAVAGLLTGFGIARFSSFRVGQAVASSIVTSHSV